jgi:hypothetical protein
LFTDAIKHRSYLEKEVLEILVHNIVKINCWIKFYVSECIFLKWGPYQSINRVALETSCTELVVTDSIVNRPCATASEPDNRELLAWPSFNRLPPSVTAH